MGEKYFKKSGWPYKLAIVVFGVAILAGLLFGINNSTGAAIGVLGKPTLSLGVSLFCLGVVGLFVVLHRS